MWRTVHVIVNARAGANCGQRILKNIQTALTKSGLKPFITLTRYRGHAQHLAREAVKNNFDLIISVGGDGTINEIINGMMEWNDKVANLPVLGIISAGTGSDLCRTLHIPFDCNHALQIILKGNVQPVDIGRAIFKDNARVWYRHFINVLDVGLGGNVVRIANHIPKNLGGFATFLIASLLVLAIHRPSPLQIYIDGLFKDEGMVNIIGAANGKYFGGGMKIAPMACLNDGYLEILYVKNTNIFQFIGKVLLPVYQARHLLYKKLYHYRAQKLKIVAEKKFLVDIDGEEEKAREVEIILIPQKIKIVIP
ncbi:MAG: diacylglycerol kinase family protein [candidate division WOR-3 bacterium]